MEENNKSKGNLKDKLTDIIYDLRDDKRKLATICVIVVFIIMFVKGCSANMASRDSGGYENYESSEGYASVSEGFSGDEGEVVRELYNQDLLDKQPDLSAKYGVLAEGYIWDYDGTVLSLGNKDLSAEEAMYAFLNGIRTLDFSSAQLYSRNSSVIKRYDEFYSVKGSSGSSYSDNFYRNMYTLVLMSIQTRGVTNIATFANDKQVFTVELEIIDLSDKDFWLDDKMEIYNNLYIYEHDEGDSSKFEQYIYDYILDYYKNEDIKKRLITVNLTLEKDATLDTGWLVMIDNDIDSYCFYKDGVSVNKYIIYQYQNEGRELIRERELSNKQAGSVY